MLGLEGVSSDPVDVKTLRGKNGERKCLHAGLGMCKKLV